MKSDELNQAPTGGYKVLANEVLSYLIKHPEAQDTLEGIAEWWLLEQRVFEVSGNLKVVLNDLVDRGFLQAIRSKDGRFSYRLNREMEREIRSHLRSAATTAPPAPKRRPSKE